MKFLITTLNSKYVHTSLAVRCLYAVVKDAFDVVMDEYTINDNINSVLASVYRHGADAVCVSCYIWNFGMVVSLCDSLKKAAPSVKIILGGPEVTYTAQETLQKYSFADIVMMGEGEITIRELFSALENGAPLDGINGIAYRDKTGEITVNAHREPVVSLDELPFVYDNSIDDLGSRIIYYETSRGCPFSCTYCLSGEHGGVRYLSIDRIKHDIDFFVGHKIPLVKLVDRTFNANPKRAKAIFEYIISKAADTRFHMELAGDLLDDETIDILSRADEKTFQFEIGVQTTNEKTMNEIHRNIKKDKLWNNIKKLLDRTKIHIHLDLIGGLPYEDIVSFAGSFNDVMELRPHVLQIGFLKLLKGSYILQNAEKFHYKYAADAPYEIICNDFVSYDDILTLHGIDFVFDRYYNSGSFERTMNFMFDKYDNDYYKFFYDLSKYYENNKLTKISLSKYELYDIMYNYCTSCGLDATDCLKYDYMKNIKSHNLPHWCADVMDKKFIDCCHLVLKDEEFKKNHLPHYYGIPAKTAVKSVRFGRFSCGVLLFDSVSGAVLDVTNYFTEEEVFNG